MFVQTACCQATNQPSTNPSWLFLLRFERDVSSLTHNACSITRLFLTNRGNAHTSASPYVHVDWWGQWQHLHERQTHEKLPRSHWPPYLRRKVGSLLSHRQHYFPPKIILYLSLRQRNWLCVYCSLLQYLQARIQCMYPATAQFIRTPLSTKAVAVIFFTSSPITANKRPGLVAISPPYPNVHKSTVLPLRSCFSRSHIQSEDQGRHTVQIDRVAASTHFDTVVAAPPVHRGARAYLIAIAIDRASRSISRTDGQTSCMTTHKWRLDPHCWLTISTSKVSASQRVQAGMSPVDSPIWFRWFSFASCSLSYVFARWRKRTHRRYLEFNSV